ncbi:class I adenylate-forming enzyme family protein [Streptomyces luteolus]|uniref:AMP-binding protein n=1 Tax=Streptomyces luteolus TaxID=3043615 RepID=A0ABT6SUA9_9ACTN|nr:AMP-binding protein [Streptomyces sp. B-S-A12]MDI3419189.1 AMP-binding protein [Streptomyces sp. B-S-A12]
MTGTTLTFPAVDAGAVLAGAAHHFADRVAVRDGERSLTFAELHEQAQRFARGLHEHGIAPGDTVLLLVPNCLWFPVSYWGALYAGAVVCPANPALPPAALAAQLADSGARAVVAHPASLASVYAADAPAPHLTVVVPGAAGPAAQGPTAQAPTAAAPPPPTGRAVLAAESLLRYGHAERVLRRPDDLAHLAYTGGTTGRSKAVRVLHRNLLANIAQVAWFRGAARTVLVDGLLGAEQDKERATAHHHAPGTATTLAVAPLFHAMGLIGLVGNTLVGTTVVLCARFDPERFLADVVEHEVSWLGGSPAMYRALLAAPSAAGLRVESVSNVLSGAAPIDPETVRRLGELFPNALVTEGYGLTEATMSLTLHPVDPAVGTPPGSVGLPVPGTELSIRDLTDPERELPVGGTGEVWARGPQITDGYHGRADLTADQFRDGWLRTGDVGRVDERGFLFLSGRVKDMLIYKGYNVYPLHLEDVLAGHPAVAAAAVIGVPHPEAGEIPAAYVVLRPSAMASAEELMAYVAERVAPYQRVRELHFVPALPVSAAGKILKTELRSQHE